MPLNTSIKKVLVIGAGPIVIGQACEFDYSGTQACKALKEEGCRVILVNPNPATIMTDSEVADIVYMEPIHLDILELIIKKHRPDALLPTMGGQTALNATIELDQKGILDKYSVKLIGLNVSTIQKAEDRQQFKDQVTSLGLEVPHSFLTSNWNEVKKVQSVIGFPLVIRTFFTLGGEGGGIVHNEKDLFNFCAKIFNSSQKILIEESIIGWKEYELEIMRDQAGNCIVVCGIENIDPMGVHTGDSITVSPIQTLTDKEYQKMRTAAFRIMKVINMTSGGCNVQFAIHPKTGKMYCIEINPRVSRSSALASKATGFPIARIAAKIALGYHLDELENTLVKNHFPASFEPTIDYVVIKIPRFNFEKFPEASQKLTTHMKSIGEVMAMGRTFLEAFQKAIHSLEIDQGKLFELSLSLEEIKKEIKDFDSDRIFFILQAFRLGLSIEEVHKSTYYDPWFLSQLRQMVLVEKEIKKTPFQRIQKDSLFIWKKLGFSDAHLAYLLKCSEDEIRKLRWKMDIHPVYKRVDSCSAEFPSETAYMYSTYEEECESLPKTREKIAIIGSGPNRIGQGVEFDYCCVHTIKTVKKLGFESIVINCNPETVSTDYDISDRLYLEPLTPEYILEILRIEQPNGIIVQMGGQTSLKLSQDLYQNGFKIAGTSFESIQRAEDRDGFRKFLSRFKLNQPRNASFSKEKDALVLAKKIGYPVIVRPSFIIGGSLIRILYSEEELKQYLEKISLRKASPVLVEEFLENCLEVEVDAICDGIDVFVCGIIEHLNPAGIHSGDSTCFLFSCTICPEIEEKLLKQTRLIGIEMGIIGLFNVQYIIRDREVMVIEINPRASRTIPLLSKITALPLVQIATKCILKHSLQEQKLSGVAKNRLKAMKIPVFPFSRLYIKGETLGVEMKSTGEVLCLGKSIDELFVKARFYIANHKLFPKKVRERIELARIDDKNFNVHSI